MVQERKVSRIRGDQPADKWKDPQHSSQIINAPTLDRALSYLPATGYRLRRNYPLPSSLIKHDRPLASWRYASDHVEIRILVLLCDSRLVPSCSSECLGTPSGFIQIRHPISLYPPRRHSGPSPWPFTSSQEYSSTGYAERMNSTFPYETKGLGGAVRQSLMRLGLTLIVN